MEQNLPVVAKRIWETVRVIFFMLRKGISKRKLLLDLNLMLKRGNKIATKAKSIRNLMFQYYHHNHGGNHHLDGSSGGRNANSPPQEYEFSCSNTPSFTLPSFPGAGKKSRHHHNNNFFSCAFHAPPTLDDDLTTVNVVKMALDMLQNNNNEMMMSVEASPCPYQYPSPSPARMRLPGFGRSPMVRQLRITDSPFPLRDEGDNGVVDKKAEEFIEKFYKELRKQKSG